MTELPDAHALQAYIASRLPGFDNPVVNAFREISAGWESDVYAFDLLSSSSEARPLVLRIYPGADAGEKSAREHRALQRLRQAGYPVPEVLHLCRSGSPFGKPFLIMDRAPGRPMWWETFHGPDPERSVLFGRFVRLLFDLHALDWRLLVDAAGDQDPTGWTHDPYVFVDRYLGLMRDYCTRFAQPGYLPVLDWLLARRDRVPCEHPAGVHWDFHPANLLNAEDGRVSVIDWTQFEVSDPRFDLAWTLILLGSAEGDVVRARILAAYEALQGRDVENLAFFETMACAKRLASVTISLTAGAQALGMRAGAEEMMRRHLPSLRWVYARLQALTGLTVPEVEALVVEPLLE